MIARYKINIVITIITIIKMSIGLLTRNEMKPGDNKSERSIFILKIEVMNIISNNITSIINNKKTFFGFIYVY